MSKESDLNEFRVMRHVWGSFGEEALLQAARNIVRIPPSDALTLTEQVALDAAAMDVGEYLGIICKTDFAAMNEDERDEFLRRLIIAYRKHLRAAVAAQLPF